MKNIYFLPIFWFVFMASAIGQPSITLTFTAEFNGQYISLDSIRVKNATMGGDTLLINPDSVLALDYFTGINPDQFESGIALKQNYPNPFSNKTKVELNLPAKDNVKIIIFDMLGQQLDQFEQPLDKGTHMFSFISGKSSYYLFSAISSAEIKTIKMYSMNTGDNSSCRLEYIGSKDYTNELKSVKDDEFFEYTFGDELVYVGYAGLLESGLTSIPVDDETFTFQYANNIPCIAEPTVEWEGQVYNTVQILSQCWITENMNPGVYKGDSIPQLNNGLIEKYCYNNEEDSCDVYGGLYMWGEVMQYSTTQGAQGICPPNWHIPSDEEWKILEAAADSSFLMGDDIWDEDGSRGYNAARMLKSEDHWKLDGGGYDFYGFGALPGGKSDPESGFSNLGYYGYYWTSSGELGDFAWLRRMKFDSDQTGRNDFIKNQARSVRCIRD
jgi:uncharacterized protein (TIGR02145 family)